MSNTVIIDSEINNLFLQVYDLTLSFATGGASKSQQMNLFE